MMIPHRRKKLWKLSASGGGVVEHKTPSKHLRTRYPDIFPTNTVRRRRLPAPTIENRSRRYHRNEKILGATHPNFNPIRCCLTSLIE
jgi:hypothetical protein